MSLPISAFELPQWSVIQQVICKYIYGMYQMKIFKEETENDWFA